MPCVLCAFVKNEETPIVKYLKGMDVPVRACGIEGIDALYVINLDRRPEKWDHCCQTLEPLGLCPNRFSGVDAQLFSKRELREIAGSYPLPKIKGHVGCLISHLSVLQHALRSGMQCIWVMEDDIRVVGDVRQTSSVMRSLSVVDPSWDIIYTDEDHFDAKGAVLKSLGYRFRPDGRGKYKEPSFYFKREQVLPGISRLGQRFGTYSMIFSRAGMKKVFHHFTHSYYYNPIDIELHYIPGIRQYVLEKPIVTVDVELNYRANDTAR